MTELRDFRDIAEQEADDLYPELILAPENEELAEAYVKGFMSAVSQGANYRIKRGTDNRPNYNAGVQEKTLARASQHYRKWTAEEIKVLLREDLTFPERAEMLGRTLYSVVTKFRKVTGRK